MNPGWLPGPVKRSGGSAYDDAQLPFGRSDLGPRPHEDECKRKR